MPPRKRKLAPALAAPAPAPSPSPPPSSPGSEEEEQPAPPPFFNTTFATYRASPLYIGAEEPLTPSRLATLSRRLRDTLVGDVVRGVQVGGLESDATLGRAGALEDVEWRWCGVESLIGKRAREREGSRELGSSGEALDDGEGEGQTNKKRRVLSLELGYENARFSAFLLPDLGESGAGDGKSRDSEAPSWTWQPNNNNNNNNTARDTTDTKDKPGPRAFHHLPLLLLRMPVLLRAMVTDFLSSTFDCRISPLRLGTRTIVCSWEVWLAESGIVNRRALSKDVALTLGFHAASEQQLKNNNGGAEGKDGARDLVAAEEAEVKPGLKTIDIVIPAAEVQRFVRVGEKSGGREGNDSSSSRSRKRKANKATHAEQTIRQRRKLAGAGDEEGWGWRRNSRNHGPSRPPQAAVNDDDEEEEEEEEEVLDQPFTEALALYVNHHLALDMFHPGVRILRISCDGFMLSEGRMKMASVANANREETRSDAAVWKFVGDLVRKARGKGWSRGALRLANLGMEGAATA